jgi:hypothetical protein
MSVEIDRGIMKKQNLISLSGKITIKKEVNMIKMKKIKIKKKKKQKLAYLHVIHLEKIHDHL